MARSAPRGLRLLAPEDLHVTLLFLGRSETAAALVALHALSQLALPALRRARLGAAAAFGGSRRVGAFGYDLLDTEALGQWLAQHRAALLRQAGAPPENRPPRPHLTLARQRRADPQAALEWLTAETGTVVSLDSPTLYESAPPDAGVRYRRVATA